MGWNEPAPSLGHAFLYSDGTMTDLTNSSQIISAEARGINSSGQVAGWYEWLNGVDGGVYEGFLYSHNTMSTIGGCAYGINDSGQVVGCAQSPSGRFTSTLFSTATEP